MAASFMPFLFTISVSLTMEQMNNIRGKVAVKNKREAVTVFAMTGIPRIIHWEE